MVKGLIYILLLIAIGLSGFRIWENMPIPACSRPIAYAVGQFDERFDIDRTEFLKAIAEAEAVWERSSGRDLFVHSPESAKLPISLIYDYRQQVTETLGMIESNMKASESNYRMLEERYENLKSAYESLKSSYNARVREFESKNAAYESKVENWNNSARNDKKEFEALESERQAINADVDRIRALEAELNAKVRELNQTVEMLNRMARELNLNVERYNTVGASRGETFEGGVYYSDAEGEAINIYEFSSREKLVRVLAHELGHALGLEHISDPKAIMYELNQGDASVATASDLSALKLLCEN